MYIPAEQTIQLHDVVEQGREYSSCIYVYTCSTDNISARCSISMAEYTPALYMYIPAVQTIYLLDVVEQGIVYSRSAAVNSMAVHQPMVTQKKFDLGLY